MRTLIIYIIIFTAFSTYSARSQVPKKDASLVLEELFNRLVDNYNDNERIRINDSIRLIIDSYTKSDTVFRHRFTNLRYLGQIMSPDSLLKIITWNLVLENEPGRFYCYFMRKQEPGKENIIYRLSSAYSENPVMTDTIYDGSDWYGALYYDIKPYITGDNRSWVLLGINYGNPSISRKIIEVLSFKPDNSIVFGRKWFVSGVEKKYRVVFEYASNAMMSLRFRSDSSIVFDHLVSFSSSHKDDRQYYGPDYSFDAFNFENGVWKLNINVDARNLE